MSEEKIYGYVRVSTKEQNEDRQLNAMKNFGIAEENIFIDKQSGKDFDRPAYQSLLQKLNPNDTIVFKSVDRLGRNFYDLLEQWRIITVEKQAAIYVIDMPILDTRKKQNDLTSQLISTLILQLLSYVAQVEREFIHQRQAEGIRAARERGVKFGRKAKIKPYNYDEVLSGFPDDFYEDSLSDEYVHDSGEYMVYSDAAISQEDTAEEKEPPLRPYVKPAGFSAGMLGAGWVFLLSRKKKKKHM